LVDKETTVRKRIFLEGPDGCGKTQIAKALADLYDIPYFKVPTEVKNWNNGTFKNSIPFDMLLPTFVEQTDLGFVSDRCYVSEIVYAGVYKRETDLEALWDIDTKWSDMGAIIVMPLRRDYSVVSDELVDQDKMAEIHDAYSRFSEYTHCHVIGIYVDDFKNDLNLEIPLLFDAITKLSTTGGTKNIMLRTRL
jgi:hypothetical protein